MTLNTLASNHALANMIELYNDGTYTPEKNKQRVEAWSNALNRLNDAVIEFGNDAARLEAYINGQR